MITGGMPFGEVFFFENDKKQFIPPENDKLYQYFAKGRASQYFKKFYPDLFSTELQNLFTSIFQINPEMRSTITELLAEDWMNKETFDADQINKIMNKINEEKYDDVQKR